MSKKEKKSEITKMPKDLFKRASVEFYDDESHGDSVMIVFELKSDETLRYYGTLKNPRVKSVLGYIFTLYSDLMDACIRR